MHAIKTVTSSRSFGTYQMGRHVEAGREQGKGARSDSSAEFEHATSSHQIPAR